MRIKSNVAKNEIFVDFERFSTREWNVILTPNTISAEDGKTIVLPYYCLIQCWYLY